tara:strand:+ start:107 stop:295 length:189 start_codon:yes stop_codon:yes gene_type:complete
MEKNFDINSIVVSKDNNDIYYTIIGKKLLNGILHYLLQTDKEKIFLSKFALEDRFIKVNLDE